MLADGSKGQRFKSCHLLHVSVEFDSGLMKGLNGAVDESSK
jgi:hypothetical protein